METNDNMLNQFFSENKKEIADNGFTRRVMRQLPETTDRTWIVWVFATIGMAISIYFGISSGLIEQLMMLLKHVSIYYILGAVFLFPFVGTAGFYLTQKKSYRMI